MPTSLPGTRLFGATGLEADLWAQRLDLDVVPSARVEVARDDIGRTPSPGDHRAPRTDADYVEPVLRLGLVQRLSAALSIRANGGRYARLPTMMERYGNGGLVIGNPDLVPETGFNADLGARLTVGGPKASLTWDAALFAARVENLIHWQKGDYNGRFHNVGRARVLGAESALSGRLHERLFLLAQGTFTDARDTSGLAASDGRQLPQRPRLRAYVRPELRGAPLGPQLRAGIYADLDYTGGNFLDAANRAPLPSRALFGAGGFLAAPALDLRLVLSALNLGDSRVVDLADFPLPGRSVFLTLEWSSSQNASQEQHP